MALHLSDSPYLLRRVSWRWFSVGIICVFWITQFAAYTTYQLLNAPKLAVDMLLPRALISISGMVLTFGILAIQVRLRRRRLSLRAIAAVVLAFAGAGAHLLIARQISVAIVPELVDSAFTWSGYASDLLDRMWIFAAVSAIILALSYSADVREREERISVLQSLAHAAQLRALRNQLNPHFLFNALNSIASLMSRNRGEEAERMTENLADFLRETLALDPQKLITLAEEIRLQELYLEIEKVRFPDRLSVTVDIPKDLKEALVPSLITQPLIENSIKYAVARSTEPVELRIEAAAAPGERCLTLAIEDSGGDADSIKSKGANVGIVNVAERLRAHFGDAARIDCESKPNGGFRNVLLIPISP